MKAKRKKKSEVAKLEGAYGKPLSEFPKLSSARIGERVFVHPIAQLSDTTFVTRKGWIVLGWTSPPCEGSGPDAIVYEKISPPDEKPSSYDNHWHFEPGRYWGHGNSAKMTFLRNVPSEDKCFMLRKYGEDSE